MMSSNSLSMYRLMLMAGADAADLVPGGGGFMPHARNSDLLPCRGR